MKVLFVLFLCGVLGGCCPSCEKIKQEPFWSDIDLSAYESVPDLRVPALTARDWAKVRPAEQADYWEFRQNDKLVIAHAGKKCATASNIDPCVADFDAKKGTTNLDINGDIIRGGLIVQCAQSDPPKPCSLSIVSNHGDNNRVWDREEGPRNFLGDIDSKEEAILLAYSAGADIISFYGSNTNKEDGAIREIDGEYELIVLFDSHGNPHQTGEERALIRIDRSGALRMLRHQFPQR